MEVQDPHMARETSHKKEKCKLGVPHFIKSLKNRSLIAIAVQIFLEGGVQYF